MKLKVYTHLDIQYASPYEKHEEPTRNQQGTLQRTISSTSADVVITLSTKKPLTRMPASLTPFSNSRLTHIHIYLFCSLFFPPRFMTKYVCGSFILHRFEWFWFFMFMYFCLISSPSYDNFFLLFVVFIIMHSFSNKTTGSFTHIFSQTFVVVYFPRLLIVLFFCFHFVLIFL